MTRKTKPKIAEDAGPRCSNCACYRAGLTESEQMIDLVGHCRLFPPTPIADTEGEPVMVRASVDADDWCAQWRAAH